MRKLLISFMCSSALLSGCKLTIENQNHCSERTVFSPNGSEDMLEFVDLYRKNAWGTWAITREASQDIHLPLGWMKQNYLNASMDRSDFMKSPGCPKDQEFNEQDMVGGRFFNIVEIVEWPVDVDNSDGLLHRGIVRKYQRLYFNAGSKISVLRNEENKRWIRVAFDSRKPDELPMLPEGWTISAFELNRPLNVNLYGDIENTETSDGSLYQGPLDDELNFDQEELFTEI